MVLSAMFIGLALLLPLLTGQIQQFGRMLCPMHIPVLLCGFFCGPFYGLAVGMLAPLMRSMIFGMPVLMPEGLAMCFELAAYGFFAGFFYKLLPKKIPFIYVSLILAMLIGRTVLGAANVILYTINKSSYSWQLFIAGAFTNAVPGIILQLVLIPAIVMALQRFVIWNE